MKRGKRSGDWDGKGEGFSERVFLKKSSNNSIPPAPSSPSHHHQSFQNVPRVFSLPPLSPARGRPEMGMGWSLWCNGRKPGTKTREREEERGCWWGGYVGSFAGHDWKKERRLGKADFSFFSRALGWEKLGFVFAFLQTHTTFASSLPHPNPSKPPPPERQVWG